jgi:tetratricopeptide (TPR) repeat protein
MKKLMMMAMMLVASATAFAGDSDALKAILKAKTYAEADALVKSSLANLANDAEKAKAYNKLVDLAYEAFMAQSTIQTENQLNKQMGKEEKPVDENLMSEMAYAAVTAALECDTYDQKPNEKGKVSAKFDKKNAERLWVAVRNQLVNAGQTAAQNHDDAATLKYWGLFMDSDLAPMFAACDRTAQSDFIGQVAYFAGDIAHKSGLPEKAKQYFTVCANDPKTEAQFKDAAHINVLNMMKEGLSTKDDSLRVLNDFKQMLTQKPDDDLLLDVIYNFLGDLKDKAAQTTLLDEALARNPQSFIALADKGFSLLEENPAEACGFLKRALEVKPDNAMIAMYIGTSLSLQAQNTEDPAQKKAFYKDAITYYDKAKELDPDMLQAKWGYNRYNAYYNYYGEDAPETKQAEAESH